MANITLTDEEKSIFKSMIEAKVYLKNQLDQILYELERTSVRIYLAQQEVEKRAGITLDNARYQLDLVNGEIIDKGEQPKAAEEPQANADATNG